MSERRDGEERQADRRPPEGVRIIGAEEAQAALDAGHAAGKRSEEELRYGDVPPAPIGPRSPHRFPLPDHSDPAEAIPRPAVAPQVRSDDAPVRPRTTRPVTPSDAHDPRPWRERLGPAAQQGEGGQVGDDEEPESDGPETAPQPVIPSSPTVWEGDAGEGDPETPGWSTRWATEAEAGATGDEEAGDQSEPEEGQEAPAVPAWGQLPDEPDTGYRLPDPSPATLWADEPAAPEVADRPASSESGWEDVPESGWEDVPESGWEDASESGWEDVPDPVERPWSSPPGFSEQSASQPGDLDPALTSRIEPATPPSSIPPSVWAPLAWVPPDIGDSDDSITATRESPVARGWSSPPSLSSSESTSTATPDDIAEAPSVTDVAPSVPDVAPSVTDVAPSVTDEPGWPPADPIEAAPVAEVTFDRDWSPEVQEPSEAAPVGFDLSSEAGYPDEPVTEPHPIDAPAAAAAAGSTPDVPSQDEPLEEGISMSGSGPDMPHWTDPPTGEVPRILGDEPPAADELAAWEALGSKGMRWRDQDDDWDDLEFDQLGDEETRVGALDSSRTEHSDLYSFDEEFERLEEERSGAHPVVEPEEYVDEEPLEDVEYEPEPIHVGSSGGPGGRPVARLPRDGGAGVGAGRAGRSVPGADGSLSNRVVVGAVLLALLLICWAIGPKALLVLTAVVLVAAAAEGYGMLQRSGFRPATLLGLVATAGLTFGAYWRGVEALPLVCALMFGGSMLWYLLGIAEARPLANVAVTTMTFLWVGLLGSFGALLLGSHHHPAGLFIGAVFPALAADVLAFLVGGRVGTHLLAPKVSPGKTWEGFIAGLVGAIIVGAIVGKEIAPWGGAKHGIILGLVIGIVSPMGDLFESMVKRDLSVKDSGTVLSGHGGLLDRFDSVLVALPVAYYLADLFNVLIPK